MESHPTPVSSDRYPASQFTIGGHQVTVHGLTTLPLTRCQITLVSLLHPRLQVASYMAPIASSILDTATQPTLCISFDQRNHGTREIEALRNEAWRQGNPRHALDLFSSYQGTALDLSNILDFLPAYLFPNDEHEIARHIVSGVSLGGHSSWIALCNDSRIEAAGVIIGCADYTKLMEHRAGKSKLQAFTLGASDHFPKTLLEVVKRYDPAAMGVEEAAKRLQGKKVLTLSGGADKLVPYACNEEFLRELKEKSGVEVKDIVYEGIGHECTPTMVEELAKWVNEVVVAGSGIREKL
ncbi:Alpha/Beta hydrolase protein [Pyronema domesticum]|nr:Alpha/Beta hydrolase protein [Pyronema domesticum]